ncbi:UNVERIFIED_CONTAM: hypothetical protein PYX00_006586 [Menopon gallinae]
MASNRKKLDEKHLKILRNLVSLPGNKQCFDCNQRGPTYVNMTIGSFVCTSCSGLLRGLTPPHRVKSISMATFTPEEIESIQSRGNEYCKKVWLAHYDSNHVQDTKDELLKEFMITKYEKKRYYMEPSVAMRNGNSHSPTPVASPTAGCDNYKTQHPVVPNSSLITQSPSAVSLQLNSRTQQAPMNAFKTSVSAFELTDPFGPFSSTAKTPKQQQPPPPTQQQQQQSQPQQQSFANFDNNPIFNSAMTSSASFPSAKSQAPSEDKYAALKDLDCLMKMQQQESQSQNQTLQANGWSSSGIGGSNPLNPFQADIANSNVHNPFTSGLIFQTDKLNNDINKNGNLNSSNNSVSSPWGSNLWMNNTLPNTLNTPFPTTNWNGKGNLTQVIPGNSGNPFL